MVIKKVSINNRILGLILILLFVFLLLYVYNSDWAFRRARDNVALGFFPAIGLGLSILFALFLLIDRHSREVPKLLENPDARMFYIPLFAIILSWLYLLFINWIGFIIGSILALTPAIFILGFDSIKKALISAALISLVIYAIFTLLGIMLPKGLLI